MITNRILKLGISIAVFLGAFLLVQLWFEPFSNQVVWKVVASCAVILITFSIIEKLLARIKE